MASGDPLVVMLSTNGFSVHNKCTGQKSGDLSSPRTARVPQSRAYGITNEISDRASLPKSGYTSAGDSNRGSSGV